MLAAGLSSRKPIGVVFGGGPHPQYFTINAQHMTEAATEGELLAPPWDLALNVITLHI